MDAEQTIEIMYSCHLCGLKKIPVAVPARMSADQDVAKWLQAAASLLGADHNKRSPHCRVDTLSEVMVPVSGADHIGGVSKN